MAEQPPKKPEAQSPAVIDKGSAINWNDFQKLQEADIAKLEQIVGPLKKTDPNSDAGTSANTKQAFAPLSIKKCCPFNSTDWDRTGHMTGASARAKRDIASLYSQPLPGIFFVPKEDDFTCVNSMIIGNFDTPYEGGFFFFYIRFGPQYPFEPPRVCAMSCYRFGNKVRFNPNMYEDGTVCLSILGTWRGPAWTAANNLAGVLLSIQSLFCEQALCNEPGYSNRRDTGDKSVQMYDVYVRHETLRVAVIHSIECAEEYKVPPELIKVMKCSFMEYYDSYIASCDALAKYDNQKFQITLRTFHIFSPNFSKLKDKLVKLHAKLLEEEETEEGTPSGKNKFIKDNTPAICSSSESSLSEFSDDSSPNSCISPSKDKTSPASVSGSSCVHSLQDASEAKSHEATAASTASSSKNETRQRNPFKLKKISGLTNAVHSLLSNTLQGGSSLPSKKLVKSKVLNTKVANVVKIDSAPCEKIIKELSSLDEAVPSTSNWVKMEQCLDFLSFMAESESEDEELSNNDQPLGDDEDGNVSDGSARISDGNCDQQKVAVGSTPDTLDTSAVVGGGSGANSRPLREDLTQGESSSSPDPNVESADVGSVGNRTDEVDSKETSGQSKDEEVSDSGCAEEELNGDSAGRGLKRESSGVIKLGLEENKECPSPPHLQ